MYTFLVGVVSPLLGVCEGVVVDEVAVFAVPGVVVVGVVAGKGACVTTSPYTRKTCNVHITLQLLAICATFDDCPLKERYTKC